jgi:hypothetical protein
MAFSLVPLGVGMWTAHLLFHAASAWTTASITGMELLFLEAGLLLTLYIAWRTSEKHFLPWAAVAGLLFSAGVWILFQPMQMRGMMH